jgi:hypothetical protein
MSSLARRIAISACACVGAVAAIAPAAASAAPVWQLDSPATASGVDFHAVAAYRPAGQATDVIVAVGQDPVTQAPAIYRRVNDSWQQDSLPAALTHACLVDVAITASATWAIGNQDGCTGATPVALRLTGELTKSAASAEWASFDLSGPQGVPGPLTSIVLDGANGFLANASGSVYRIEDGDTPHLGAAVTYSPNDQVKPKALTGLALAASDRALAVGDSAIAASPRIFSVTSSQASPEPFQPDPDGIVPLVGVGAAIGAPATTAVAIEDGAYWVPSDNGIWTRQRTSTFTDQGTDLNGVTVTGSGDTLTSAIAGSLPGSGSPEGAVWLRSGAAGWPASNGGWKRYPGLGTALADVSVVAPDDVWAAGAQGNIRHFGEPPPPEVKSGGDTGGETGSGGGGGTDAGGGAGGATGDTGGGSGGGSTPATVVIENPAPSQTPPSSTTQPPAKRPTTSQRLLRNVRVKMIRGRLIISFRLVAPARVGAQARTAGRLVGRLRERLLAPGRRTLVLRYRGRRPPTQLQLIVRPRA